MKTVVITGASRGIGAGIAKAFASGGYRIFINCIANKEKMEEIVSYIRSKGTECRGILCDVTDPEAVNNMFEEIGDVDLLINNAGISHVGLLAEMSSEEWHRVMDTNVTSIFNCCRAVIPAMVRRKSGRIINISSVWGERGASCEVAYSASKGAVDAFTKALAKELAPSNIQVNAVACGMVNTDMNSHLTEEDLAEITNEIPAGRVAQVDEIGIFVKNIAETDNYFTGQIVKIDGAWM